VRDNRANGRLVARARVTTDQRACMHRKSLVERLLGHHRLPRASDTLGR
jgi:hypothetical protein